MKYITTPIYYINGDPHIGHAYTTICADVLSRFWRMNKEEVFFMTGADEHGQKVAKSAEKKGMDPQSFVNQEVKKFQQMCEDLDIKKDYFLRTSSQMHHDAVKDFWNKLIKKGFLYKGIYSGWYSERDEAFYDTKEIKNETAPTGSPVKFITEYCYFFKLSAFQNKLLSLYEQNSEFITPRSRYNEIVKFVSSGLQDLCVSRNNVQWGIKVPQDEKSTIYVWLDALVNYLTGIGYPNFNKELWENSYHIIGKDITRFHAIYWPAFLMANDIPTPKKIITHGWWLTEGNKISKSIGKALTYQELVNKYGIDEVRYYLLREISFGEDGEVNKQNVIKRINNDLVKDLSNLLHRTLVIAHNQLDKKTPYPDNLSMCDHDILRQKSYMKKDLIQYINKENFSGYLQYVWNLIAKTNKYFSDEEPWKMNEERKSSIVYITLNMLKDIIIALYPFMPNKMLKAMKNIGEEPIMYLDNLNKVIQPGRELPTPEILFKIIKK